MNITCESTIGGWQTAIDGQTFGPTLRKTPDLLAWQKSVLQAQTLNREQVAILGAVLEYAISQAANGENPPIFNLACELFHNLNLGE